MTALALTIGVQAQEETVDTAQLVAVYDYECRTQDDEAAPITDRMQLVVQVGRTVTKSMPYSAYPFTDNGSKADVATGFQEALMHMPTVWTGGLPGLIVKAESEAHTFCLAGLRQEASPITAPEQRVDVLRMKYAKLLKHKNEILSNRQYAKNPMYYVPNLQGSITDMNVFNHNGQQLLFANGGHPLLTKAHVYQPLEKE